MLGRDEWEVIGLKDGDEVVGAVELATGEEELCFISTDAQLLHFPASGVRPQGRSGGGMAGIKLGAGQQVAFFGAFDPADAVVVTASGSSTALPGTEAGAVKVTPFTEYPGKGRATGGVRSHRFLKGEDTLVAAWAGPGPARAAAASGAPVDLPEADGRRDGSGVPAPQPIAAVASPVADPGRRTRGRIDRLRARPCGRLTPCPLAPGPPSLAATAAPPRRAQPRRLLGRRARRRRGQGARGGARRGLRPSSTETSGVQLTLDRRHAARGRLRHRQGRRHRDQAHRPSTGRSRSSSPARPSDVPVIAVDDKVYAQLPFTGGAWDKVNPKEYGAPDPAVARRRRRLPRPARRSPSPPRRARACAAASDNSEILTTYSGTVPGDAMDAIIPSSSGDSFDVEWQVNDDGELTKATMEGVFYPHTDPMTYTVEFADYGTEKDITAP